MDTVIKASQVVEHFVTINNETAVVTDQNRKKKSGCYLSGTRASIRKPVTNLEAHFVFPILREVGKTNAFNLEI